MFYLIKKFSLNNKKTLFFMFFFSILSAIFFVAQPFLIVLIFNLVKTQFLPEVASSSSSEIAKNFFNLEKIFLLSKEYLIQYLSYFIFLNQLIILCSIFILVSIFFLIFKISSSFFVELRETDTAFQIRNLLKDKILEYDLLDYKKLQSGYLQSIFLKDTEDLSIISGSFINSLLFNIVQILFIFIFLISTSYSLCVIIFIIFLFHFSYNRVLNYPIILNTKKNYEFSGKMSAKIIDYLNNYKILKLSNSENNTIDLKKSFYNFKKQELKVKILTALQNPARVFIDSLSIILILFFIIYFINKNVISIEAGILFILFTKYATGPISSVATVLMWGKTIVSAHSRIEKILNYNTKILNGSIKNVSFDNQLEFKNISFAYGDFQVIKNLSFVIKKNTHNLICGKNGSGKSTVLDLLTRMIEPQQGSIFIDNIDIKKIDIKNYQNLFSYISQNNYFIDGTIEENIIFGTNLKDTDKNFDQLVYDVLKLIDGMFVYEYPLKLKTSVGEFGNLLSGGQKQKICIARALLQKTKIIIFDESTSGFDTQSKENFRKLINKLTAFATIVEVDHAHLLDDKPNIIYL